MKRFLLIPLLVISAFMSVGCANNDGTIQAAAPAGEFKQAGVVGSGGTYTLYHVSQWDDWGMPLNAAKVMTIDLQQNTKVGFEYVLPRDKKYDPNAQSDVVAYAGSFRRTLGPIHTMNEAYYWSNSGWESFWSGRPERVLSNRMTMH